MFPVSDAYTLQTFGDSSLLNSLTAELTGIVHYPNGQHSVLIRASLSDLICHPHCLSSLLLSI